MRLAFYKNIFFLLAIVLFFAFMFSYINVMADAKCGSFCDVFGNYSSSSLKSSYNIIDNNDKSMILEPYFIPVYGLFSSLTGFIVLIVIISIIKHFKNNLFVFDIKSLKKPFLIYNIIHIIYLVIEFFISIYSYKLFEIMLYFDLGLPLGLFLIIIIFLAFYSLYLIGKYIFLIYCCKFKQIEGRLSFHDDIFVPDELRNFLGCKNVNDVKKLLFDNYVSVQNAYMNYNYDELKILCSDEIYNSYYKELEDLKLKHCKNIMKNFDCSKNCIYKIKKCGNKYILYYYLDVTYIDYVINTKTNKVTSGKKTIPTSNKYLLEYEINHNNSIDGDSRNIKMINKGIFKR